MKKKIAKISILVIVVAIVLCVMNSISILNKGEYGVIKQFGKIVRIEKEPGIIIKAPFIQSMTEISKKDQLYDMEESDVMTSDKKSMIADCYVLWNITDPIKYSQTVNSLKNAESRISIAVYNTMKNTISSSTQEEVISGKDGSLSNTITSKVQDSILEYGIQIISVDMKLLDLPADNKDAVYNRMISDRQKIAAQYTAEGKEKADKIRNNTDNEVRKTISNAKKDAEIKIAEGESEYMHTIAKAYNNPNKQDFYSFLRGLEAMENSFADDSSLILDDNSPLVKNFKYNEK